MTGFTKKRTLSSHDEKLIRTIIKRKINPTRVDDSFFTWNDVDIPDTSKLQDHSREVLRIGITAINSEATQLNGQLRRNKALHFIYDHKYRITGTTLLAFMLTFMGITIWQTVKTAHEGPNNSSTAWGLGGILPALVITIILVLCCLMCHLMNPEEATPFPSVPKEDQTKLTKLVTLLNDTLPPSIGKLSSKENYTVDEYEQTLDQVTDTTKMYQQQLERKALNTEQGYLLTERPKFDEKHIKSAADKLIGIPENHCAHEKHITLEVN